MDTDILSIGSEAAQARATSKDTALWHSQANMGRVRHAEIVFARGEGAYLWDEHGRRLLDVPASLWYCNIGHGRREIAEAVADQIATLETYSTFGRFANPPALELAERVCDLAPMPNPKIFFSNGGSDAVDTAAKLSWRYWNAVGQPSKRVMITREGAYHGLHVFGTSIAGIPGNREGYGLLLDHACRVPANDAEALERTIAECGAEQVAAFFCEPVIGGGGVIPPRDGYLSHVQSICQENDVLFVVDEVVTGFGRTGHVFASERFGLRPDLMVVAKGITSGYLPLGATVISERLWDPFWRDEGDLVFRHGLTYAGHAAACRAALVNLDILERERLVERVLDLEAPLRESMEALVDHQLVREVRTGVGLLAGIELVSPKLAEAVVEECFANGVLMRLIGDGSTLQVSPPFVITAEEVAEVGQVVRTALDRAAEAA